MILYRPVGEQELALIRQSGMKRFPPRLPEQPIFYPVLTEQYAEEIASKWNVHDENSGHKGYVLQFSIDDAYIAGFDVRTAGASYHQEYWIPAEELDRFNAHIIGDISILSAFQ